PPAMDAADLRPLGVGEVLDAGIKIYRRRFGTLVRATASVVVPVSIISGIVGVSAATSNGSDTNFNGGDAAAIGAVVIVALIGVVVRQHVIAASLAIAARH